MVHKSTTVDAECNIFLFLFCLFVRMKGCGEVVGSRRVVLMRVERGRREYGRKEGRKR
jgi:hypothetical protein